MTSSKAPNEVLIAGSDGSLKECPSNVEHLQALSNKRNTYMVHIKRVLNLSSLYAMHDFEYMYLV